MNDRNPQAVAALPSEVRDYLAAWRLRTDGGLITTRSSWILPVRRDAAAILKVARIPDERRGYELMRWWNGQGAAAVLEATSNALLLERAAGGRSLATLAWAGGDDRAVATLCEVAARLHAPGNGHTAPDLHQLEAWFQPLLEFREPPDWLARSAAIARTLLAAQQSISPLHGDLHHDNVLDFGARGWLAIDPHGLLGERTFDYANIFTNPDLSDPQRPLATLPGRLEARLRIVTERSGIAPAHMLRWIIAWTGLSAAWFLGDGDEAGAAIDRAINGIASGLLGG